MTNLDELRIDVSQIGDLMRSGERIFFVDTRSPTAYAAATEQIPGSMRSRADEISARADEIPVEAVTVAYCT